MAATHPELLVEEGLQAGLSAPLGDGSSSVGSDIHSAVVIADPSLLPSHFTVTFANGTTALRALAGEVVLADGTWLAPGEERVLNNGCSFTAGATRFSLRVPAIALPAPAEAARQRSVISIMSGVAAVVAAGMLLFTASGLRPGRATPVGVDHAIPHVDQTVTRAVSLDRVVGALRSRLDAAGLSDVAVSPVNDGSIVAQGALMPSQMAAWVALREWYDSQYGANRVLVDQVSASTAAPTLAVAAVWAGAAPYVVDENGSKLFVGASVGDGWVISAIEQGKVLVRNGTQQVAIRY